MSVHINKDNYEQEILNSDVPVVVDFWAPWCMPCQMMAPVFEELGNDYEGKVKFAKVNIEEENELANQHAVQSIPTLLVMRDGKEINRIVGFGPKPVMKEKIDSILAS